MIEGAVIIRTSWTGSLHRSFSSLSSLSAVGTVGSRKEDDRDAVCGGEAAREG
ncbi:MAG: hypothetical protein N2V77_03335 [Canidatus Methanoxibalbensis ujae]|nr:hypothetical protein [Candidatus Methanoxibalbensis ujae]